MRACWIASLIASTCSLVVVVIATDSPTAWCVEPRRGDGGEVLVEGAGADPTVGLVDVEHVESPARRRSDASASQSWVNRWIRSSSTVRAVVQISANIPPRPTACSWRGSPINANRHRCSVGELDEAGAGPGSTTMPASSTITVAPGGSCQSARGPSGRAIRGAAWRPCRRASRSRVPAPEPPSQSGRHRTPPDRGPVEVGDSGGEHRRLARPRRTDDHHEPVGTGDGGGGVGLQHVQAFRVDRGDGVGGSVWVVERPGEDRFLLGEDPPAGHLRRDRFDPHRPTIRHPHTPTAAAGRGRCTGRGPDRSHASSARAHRSPSTCRAAGGSGRVTARRTSIRCHTERRSADSVHHIRRGPAPASCGTPGRLRRSTPRRTLGVTPMLAASLRHRAGRSATVCRSCAAGCPRRLHVPARRAPTVVGSRPSRSRNSASFTSSASRTSAARFENTSDSSGWHAGDLGLTVDDLTEGDPVPVRRARRAAPTGTGHRARADGASTPARRAPTSARRRSGPCAEITTWVCNCGSSNRDVVCRNAATVNPWLSGCSRPPFERTRVVDPNRSTAPITARTATSWHSARRSSPVSAHQHRQRLRRRQRRVEPRHRADHPTVRQRPIPQRAAEHLPGRRVTTGQQQLQRLGRHLARQAERGGLARRATRPAPHPARRSGTACSSAPSRQPTLRTSSSPAS